VLIVFTVNNPAAPTPATPLPASIIGMFCAAVDNALPTRKNTSEICIAQCRPKTSAIDAKRGRNTVDVRR
jgi:hypothetical protein